MTCHELPDAFLAGLDGLSGYPPKYAPPPTYPTSRPSSSTTRVGRRVPLHLTIDAPTLMGSETGTNLSDTRVGVYSHANASTLGTSNNTTSSLSHYHASKPPRRYSENAIHHHQQQPQSHHQPPPQQPPQHAHMHLMSTSIPSPYVPITSYFVSTFTKDAFIHVCAHYLDDCTRRNADFVTLPTHSEPESVFFSIAKPDIPTVEYVRRLVNYTQCSPSAFIVMLIYLDRIASKNKQLVITPYNLHRLLVTALTLSCKMLDDRCFANAHYAKVGGIRTAREMNRLELQFLLYVDYRLHVKPELYHEKEFALAKLCPPVSPRAVNHHAMDMATARVSPAKSPSPSPGHMGVSRTPSPAHTGAPMLYGTPSGVASTPSPRVRSVHDLVTGIRTQRGNSRPSSSYDLSSVSTGCVMGNTSMEMPRLSYGRSDDFYVHHGHVHNQQSLHGCTPQQLQQPQQHQQHMGSQLSGSSSCSSTTGSTGGLVTTSRPSQSQPLPHMFSTPHKRGRRASTSGAAGYSGDSLGPTTTAAAAYGASVWYTARA